MSLHKVGCLPRVWHFDSTSYALRLSQAGLIIGNSFSAMYNQFVCFTVGFHYKKKWLKMKFYYLYMNIAQTYNPFTKQRIQEVVVILSITDNVLIVEHNFKEYFWLNKVRV